jgi:hypothetical protein
VGLIVVLAAHHEAWRDEADTWLMARDASLREILHRTGYGGTPILWYAVLFPFAKAGLPFMTQEVVHVSIAAWAVWLLLTRAPFPLAVRVLIAFGYYVSFEYSVVARCYVLVLLGLFLLAARDGPATFLDGLLLALMASSTAHGFVLAAAILGVRFREFPREARIVAGLGLAFALWQLWPPADGYIAPIGFLRHARALPRIAPLAFYPDYDSTLFEMAGAGLMGIATFRLARRTRSLVLLLLGWGCLLALFVFVYVSGMRHVGMLALWLLFVMWEDGARGVGPGPGAIVNGAFGVLVAASLLTSVATAVRTWRLEIASNFSEGAEMAAFLRHRGFSLAPLAAHPAPHSEAVLVHLPKRTFWYPGIEEDGSYMKWDAAYTRGRLLPPEEAVARVLRRFPADRRPLLLLNQELPDSALGGYRQIHATPGNISVHKLPHTDERFFLYAPGPAPGN